MAFVTGIGDDLEAVPPRTEDGRRGVVFPVLTDDTQAINVALSGCMACSKREDHGNPCCQVARKVNAGQHPLDGMPAGQTLSAQQLHKTTCAHWATGYALNGVPTWLPYNLNALTANNLAQYVRYEVTAIVGPRRATLKGRNPKRIVTGVSNLNPVWPEEAPESMRPPGVTDETWNGTPGASPPYSDGMKYALLIPSSRAHCLPLGSLAAFAYPSVLVRKCLPYVTKIHAPEVDDLEDVEFDVEFSHTISEARTPYDLAYPPSDGKYYVGLFYYAVAPENWPNFQELEPAWFTTRELTVTAAALAEDDGIVDLNDTEGYPCRVLFPSMGTGVMRVSYRTASTIVTLSDAEVTAILTTEDDGTFWSTWIDLSNLLLTVVGLVDVTIKYMPEAVSADTQVIACQGSCSNSQRDWTGSYKHGETKRCMNIACSKFNQETGGYRDTCWDPKATGFVRGYGTGEFPITNPRESGWLSAIWSECSFKLEQGLPGFNTSRNFWYARTGKPSLQEYVGGFSDQVPQGKFARKLPLFSARMGQRHVYTDGDGNPQHRLIHGLFFPRTFENGIDLGYVGALRANVTEWSSRIDARRDILDDPGGDFARHGPAGLHVYDYTGQTNGLSFTKRVSAEARQVFVTGQLADVEDPGVATIVRNCV